jgi:immune inhibitor A
LRKYVLLLVTLGICICACLAFDVFAASMVMVRDVISSLEEPVVIPTVLREEVADETRSTAQLLRETTIPERDLYALAERLNHTGPVPRVVNETPPSYSIGQRETFWINDEELSDTYLTIEATLRYATPHVYMWVEDGLSLSQEGIEASAHQFEDHIYPTNHEYFGDEWSPGVDDDVHIHVLNANLPSVGGYYSSYDEYPRSVNQYSNEKEMVYINAGAVPPGNDVYDSYLAHEFQHMIHWNVDPNEDTWVNEGCAQTAESLNGYDASIWQFLREPDTQLTGWADEISEAGAHYEASHLFVYYFAERFGPELTRELTATEADGMEGFDRVLADNGFGVTSHDVFEDWLIANFLNDTALDDGRYGYSGIDLSDGVSIDYEHWSYPDVRASTVHQYAADYIELGSGHGDLVVEFTGSTQVSLVDNDPHSGRYEWWSNRGDVSNMRLTREFDLTGLGSATLEFWTWYDIEDDYDYAYVEASTDSGENWDILAGEHTSDSNPYGNSFGLGYTGTSGGGDRAVWVREAVDLTPYAGQPVLIRFEYVTDDSYNDPGFCVDDISIPELGYAYDAETAGGWEAEGFILSSNIVPQEWIVQVITFGEETSVLEMELTETQEGRLVVDDFGSAVEEAVLVVSAMAPATTEMASYEYSVHLTE